MFLDLFCGCGVVSLNVNATDKILNDTDINIINLIKYFKDNTPQDIINQINNLIEEYNINKILLEDIQLQGQTNNVETYRKLAEVRGVLSELACEMKIPHEIIHSQTWKSTLNIKGRDRTT